MIKIVLVAVFVTLTLTLAQAPQKPDNIEYLSMGYNIYYGDPLANSVDPGFCLSPIFNLTYLQNQTTADGKFLEPDLITVAAENSCVLNSAASAITSSSTYTHSLSVFASVDVGCPFASFSASTNYQTVSQNTNDQSTLYTLSTGQCSVYVAEITLTNFPQLTDMFLQDAVTYLEGSDSDLHYEFLAGYGTHYVKSITMGSRLSVMNQLTSTDWQNLEEEDVSVTVAAQASFMGMYAGFSTSTNTNNTQIQDYETSSSNFQMTTIGSLPVGNATALQWAQQAITNPMPIQYELAPISDLFSTSLGVGLASSIESTTLAQIQTNLNNALNGGYCKYLMNQGLVEACTASVTNNTTPVADGSCVLCANGCGGTYSQQEAVFDVGQEQANWFLYYNAECSQTALLNSDGYTASSGVSMCCIPESAEVQGSCRMCTSCGGSYSYSSGSMWDGDKGQIYVGWFQTYTDSCAGDLQGLPNPESGYELCCDQPDVCAFCSSCGGSYPYETGVIANTDVNQFSFGFYQDQCSGTIGSDELAGDSGFNLCCSSHVSNN